MMPPHPATTLFPYTTLFRSAAYEAPEHFKQYREGYERIKSAAKDHEQSQVGFEFGYKKFGDDLAMKAQGVTGLTGEGASGTTAPAALANGAYFLAGTAGPFIAPEFVPGVVDLRFYENVVAQLIPSYAVD